MTGARAVQAYWYRLRAMDPAEVAHRVFEQALRWTDRAARRDIARAVLPGRVGAFPQLPARNAAPQTVREAVRAAAQQIRAGRWILYGWKEVRVSDPPDWHRDYLRDGAADAGAEPRNVWETNRWSELVRLAQNAWLNQERDDARLLQRWLADWCERNPVGAGPAWRSALEAAVRLINFCWIDALVRGTGDAGLKTTQVRLARQIVPAHAWWIRRHRSFGSSANNHLIGELAALVLAGRRWPAASRVGGTAEHAWEQLSREVLRQFAPDGGNREQALHYHQFAWELAWQAFRVMGAFSGPVAERLRAAAQFLGDVSHGAEPWDFGDCDDALVPPLTQDPRAARAEWVAWLSGAASAGALTFWLGPPPTTPALPSATWRVYPATGIAVRAERDWKARLDASPLGLGRLAAHGHLDALHVSLWDGPHALVVDPGTGAYLGDRALRDRLASWEWHNGPIPVAGLHRPRRRGAFVWSDHHPAPELHVAGATCTARRQDGGAVVTRAVRYAEDLDGWEIVDDTPDDAAYVVRWRLAPDWRVASQEAATIHLVHLTGRLVQVTFQAATAFDCTIGNDLVSPHFGEICRGVVLTVRFTRRLTSQWRRSPAADS